MRRLLSVLAVCATVLAGVTAAPVLSPANAGGAGPLTGRLVDSSTWPAPFEPAANMTIQLRKLNGDVVDSDVTAADGTFSLDAGSSPEDEYMLRVLDTGAYPGGWIGGQGASGPDWVQPTEGDATSYGPSVSLGNVLALPGFVRGVVVDPATGDPVRGVTVRMIKGGPGGIVQGSAVTGRRGRFNIDGLRGEDDFGMRVDGSARGYESGWRGCSGAVVPTWGEACASPLGRAGKVRLQRL